jgi:hypothetical protein
MLSMPVLVSVSRLIMPSARGLRILVGSEQDLKESDPNNTAKQRRARYCYCYYYYYTYKYIVQMVAI